MKGRVMPIPNAERVVFKMSRPSFVHCLSNTYASRGSTHFPLPRRALNEYCSCTRGSAPPEAKGLPKTQHNSRLPTDRLASSLLLPISSMSQCYPPACSSDQSHAHPFHGHIGNLSQTPQATETQKEAIDVACATFVQILNHATIPLQMEKESRLLVNFPAQRNRRRERTLRLDTVHIADESVVFLFSSF